MAIIEPEFMELTNQLYVQAFWDENQLCEDFTTQKPRCAAAFSPEDHWLFEFMNTPSALRCYQDKAYRNELHRQVNAIIEEYVGNTFFEEDAWEHNPRRIENLFGDDHHAIYAESRYHRYLVLSPSRTDGSLS